MGGFDLDGTLVHGTTVLKHVGHHLGHLETVESLVKGYESFRLSNREVSTAAARLFTGLTRADLLGLMEDIPRLNDIDEAIGELRRKNVYCVVATVTFDFASEWFAKRYGFDTFSGIELGFDAKGRATGEVVRHFDEDDKAVFVRDQSLQLGADLGSVFYLGDSRSDLRVFEIVGFAVALNATLEAIAVAHVSVESDSLWRALTAVPGLLGDQPAC
jgi:phosphoserine phosphatase